MRDSVLHLSAVIQLLQPVARHMVLVMYTYLPVTGFSTEKNRFVLKVVQVVWHERWEIVCADNVDAVACQNIRLAVNFLYDCDETVYIACTVVMVYIASVWSIEMSERLYLL